MKRNKPVIYYDFLNKRGYYIVKNNKEIYIDIESKKYKKLYEKKIRGVRH